MMRRSRSISSRLAVVTAVLFCQISAFAIEPVSEMELKKATYKLIIEVDRLKKELKQLKRANRGGAPHATALNKENTSTARKQKPDSANSHGFRNRYGEFIHDFVERNKLLLKQIKENDV